MTPLFAPAFAGLILSEATAVTPMGVGYPDTLAPR